MLQKNYAYSWFLNEQALNDPVYLNQSSILLNFTKAGNQVLRVVVSDMKGGVSSRSLLIEVGDNYLTNLSSISGTVLSKQSAVQGARVILEKASVIEHNVSITGNIRDSFYSISTGNPAKFLIDGETAPELNFRRGEIHRFNFKPSADGLDMSFLEQPENRPPKVLINMLSDARVDLEQGDGYFRNPSIKYNLSSSFSPYKSKYVGSYLDMLKFLFDKNGTIPSLEDDNGTHLGGAGVFKELESSNL
jgi:hypothetical protein